MRSLAILCAGTIVAGCGSSTGPNEVRGPSGEILTTVVTPDTALLGQGFDVAVQVRNPFSHAITVVYGSAGSQVELVDSGKTLTVGGDGFGSGPFKNDTLSLAPNQVVLLTAAKVTPYDTSADPVPATNGLNNNINVAPGQIGVAACAEGAIPPNQIGAVVPSYCARPVAVTITQ